MIVIDYYRTYKENKVKNMKKKYIFKNVLQHFCKKYFPINIFTMFCTLTVCYVFFVVS